jgi:hypothetical protein
MSITNKQNQSLCLLTQLPANRISLILNETFEFEINSKRFPDFLGKDFPATLEMLYFRVLLVEIHITNTM